MNDMFREFVNLYNKDIELLLNKYKKEELKDFLDILYSNKLIRINNDGKIIKKKFTKLYVGTLQKKENFGFLLQETEDDIYVLNVSNYFDKDFVLAIESKEKGRSKSGKIIELIKRDQANLLVKKNKKGKIVPYENNLDKKIIIKGIDQEQFHIGSIASVSIKKISGDNIITTLNKIISDESDPDLNMKIILDKYKIDVEFSDDVYNELEKIDEEILTTEINERINLKDQMFFTIDGDDSKDLDDAISLIKEGENYRLFVSIADVSYYIKEDSFLDKEAFSRATSVYFIDRVVPMIPKKISNGICSLHANVDRLTMTCEMLINKDMKVIDTKIYNSVINSKYRLTYSDVNKILVDKDSKTIDKYLDIYGILVEMNKLSKKLNKKRLKRGSFNLEDTEAKFILDENQNIIDIKPTKRYDAEKLIEEFMILANESVTKFVSLKGLPFLYRTHGSPKASKLKKLKDMLTYLSINIDLDYENLKPKDFKFILDSTDDSILKRVLSKIIVRSMQKAKYSEENIGHFGLGSKNYTHFTSPIRRYPDLEVHRLLKAYIKDENVKGVKDNLKEIAEHCSNKEVSAIKAEQDIEDRKKVEYMSKFIGQKFKGNISSIEEYGFFVELENTIRGLVRFSDLKDYKNNNLYKIEFFNDKELVFGQEVEVIVSGVNIQRALVDFVPSGFELFTKEEKEKAKKDYKNKKNSNKKNISSNKKSFKEKKYKGQKKYKNDKINYSNKKKKHKVKKKRKV